LRKEKLAVCFDQPCLPMQLAQLLKQPQFHTLHLVNDVKDLSRPLTSVSLIKDIHMQSFVMAGQLLVTTGPIPSQSLENLIATMVQKQAAGLVIQLDENQALNDKVIKAAQKQHFPLFQLEATSSLATTMKLLLTYVSQQPIQQITQVMHDTLNISKYILAQRSDDDILTHITQLLGCDTFIIDIFGRLKASNQNAQLNPHIFETIHKNISLLTLTEPCVLLHRYTLYPLKTSDPLMRRFVILDAQPPYQLDRQLLIENMINLLSLESMQIRINVNQSHQQRSEVFETILSRQMPETAFANSLIINGLNLQTPYKAWAIDEANSIDTGDHQIIMHAVSRYIYWYFEKVQLPVIVINWQFRLYVLVATSRDLKPYLTDFQEFINLKIPDAQEQIGFTEHTKTLIQFKKLLREADEALTMAKREYCFNPYRFKPHQVQDILSLVPKKEADAFIYDILGPVLDIKSTEKRDLLTILKQYFANNQSISKTAQKLFIHRNTAIYRLKKIETLLHLDLRNSQDNNQLRLATQLYFAHHS
jgi:PucR family transcriptional regulator, purine catabolism regulatory protein